MIKEKDTVSQCDVIAIREETKPKIVQSWSNVHVTRYSFFFLQFLFYFFYLRVNK